jgi:DNA polymerase-3 subunit alpha
MKKHLRNLKPTKFEDLIAMNALYRPGPMEYIDSFIARKHGDEKIEYDLPEMEEYLAETYGITVYQEQVMLLSRKLAGFSRGQSDSLRKAMGKKIIAMMNELKVLFVEGCKKNGHDLKKVEKIWKDWEAFAKYAFNKSHATCYSYVSYQTAYLKAHYPAEYLASVLSHELKDVNKLNFYLSECNRMGIKVLGPNINESYSKFTVNAKGEIHYGMEGIKGVGGAAVEAIVKERNKNGRFKSIFDFISRINLKSVNKKAVEALAIAGAFEELHPDIHRAQYFFKPSENEDSFVERLIKFGNKTQTMANSAQASLFGDMEEVQIQTPNFPECEAWSNLKRLNLEKEAIGFYLSGHPLDSYKSTFQFFVSHDINSVNELMDSHSYQAVKFAGIVTREVVKEGKNGNKYGFYTIEDKSGSIDIALFKDNFLKYNHLLQMDNFVYIKGNVKANYFDKSRTEMLSNEIMLLENVMDENSNMIKIQILLNEIDNNFTNSFIDAIKNNPGTTKLKLFFKDDNELIEMSPKSYKVSSSKFVDYLNNNTNLKFKIS